MKKLFIIVAALLGFCIAAGPVPPAFAQQNESDEFMLEEVTVTASKRSENQQKVAITMEVLSSEELKSSGKNDLDEILSNVSSVLVNKAADGLRISLRGISDDSSTFHNQSVSMPTVAVNMDGVYSNRKDTGSGLFDLERVEVLYGPQSTLYSSNSPAGIVNVVTANPKLDKYAASGTIEYGNYELLHTEGSLNVPISNTMALRAAYSTSVRDGYLSNGGDDEDSKSARLRMLYQPTETLSFVATGELSKSSSMGFGGVDVFIDQDEVEDPWYTNASTGTPDENTSKKVYGNMNWDLSVGSLSVIPSYSTRDGKSSQRMEMFGDVTVNQSVSEAEEKSVEVRMSSSEDFFFKWIVGLNYYKATDTRNSLEYDESGNPKMSETPTGDMLQGYRSVDATEEATAVFANATYPLTNTLRATAGFRQSWDDVTLYNIETRGIMGGPDSGKLEEVSEIHEDSYSDPDYKIGVEYDLNETAMLYADFSTSYRVQAMSGGGPSSGSEEKPPEKLKAYSLGAKTRFLDNKLQVNAAAFYYDYENYSAGNMVMGYYGSLDPADFPDGVVVVSTDYTDTDPNASTWGNGRQLGVDVSSTWIISPKDVLNMSVSYLNSEWTDLTFDYYYDYMVVGVPMGSPDISIDNIVPAETVSYNGKPMTSSPEWTIAANYSHRFSLWNGGNLEAKIDSRYKSDYRLSWKEADYPYNYQESFILTNFTLTYNSPDGNWNLSAYVRNIEDYAEKRSYMGEPVNEMMVGNPRTYGAVLSARF